MMTQVTLSRLLKFPHKFISAWFLFMARFALTKGYKSCLQQLVSFWDCCEEICYRFIEMFNPPVTNNIKVCSVQPSVVMCVLRYWHTPGSWLFKCQWFLGAFGVYSMGSAGSLLLSNRPLVCCNYWKPPLWCIVDALGWARWVPCTQLTSIRQIIIWNPLIL